MSQQIQTRESHTRFDPAFHFFLIPASLILLIVSFVIHFRHRNMESLLIALAFFLILVTAFLVRTYSLKVQNRVIRLEERLRLQALGDVALRARIPELTETQMVALRFASDNEVVALATKALDEKLAPKQIKALVQTWRPDFYRV